MGFLKAFTFITLWALLSFFWVRLGQSETPHCPGCAQITPWLKPYPVLKGWFEFYIDRQKAEKNGDEFFKTLAASEPLSIKLNQAEVTFEQFYVPLYHVLSVADWEAVTQEEARTLQGDFNLIDHALNQALGKMNAADQDYFRAVVLLNLPSDFVKGTSKPESANGTTLSSRLNRGREPSRLQIDNQDVTSPPYQRTYAVER